MSEKAATGGGAAAAAADKKAGGGPKKEEKKEKGDDKAATAGAAAKGKAAAVAESILEPISAKPSREDAKTSGDDAKKVRSGGSALVGWEAGCRDGIHGQDGSDHLRQTHAHAPQLTGRMVRAVTSCSADAARRRQRRRNTRPSSHVPWSSPWTCPHSKLCCRFAGPQAGSADGDEGAEGQGPMAHRLRSEPAHHMKIDTRSLGPQAESAGGSEVAEAEDSAAEGEATEKVAAEEPEEVSTTERVSLLESADDTAERVRATAASAVEHAKEASQAVRRTKSPPTHQTFLRLNMSKRLGLARQRFRPSAPAGCFAGCRQQRDPTRQPDPRPNQVYQVASCRCVASPESFCSRPQLDFGSLGRKRR